MTDEYLNKCIDSLNENMLEGQIFTKKISLTVTFAKVWSELPQGKVGNESSYDMYFVQGKNEYVGAVLDMGRNDLHFFVKEIYRKQGHLCNAMNTTILHHLFDKKREIQALTFQNIETKEYCMRRMGFRSTGELSAEITQREILQKSELCEFENNITPEGFALIKQRIGVARGYLKMCSDQLAQSNYESDDLDELVHELVWLDDRILDVIEEKQGNIKKACPHIQPDR